LEGISLRDSRSCCLPSLNRACRCVSVESLGGILADLLKGALRLFGLRRLPDPMRMTVSFATRALPLVTLSSSPTALPYRHATILSLFGFIGKQRAALWSHRFSFRCVETPCSLQADDAVQPDLMHLCSHYWATLFKLVLACCDAFSVNGPISAGTLRYRACANFRPPLREWFRISTRSSACALIWLGGPPILLSRRVPAPPVDGRDVLVETRYAFARPAQAN